MKTNMSKTDAAIRVLLAVIFISLFFTNTVQGAYAYGLLVIGIIFGVTSLFRFCPLYTLFGISTCPIDPSQKAK